MAGASPHKSLVTHSAINDGLETKILLVECGLTRGYAGVQLLGNAAETCRDGKERAKTALEHLGIYLPAQHLVMSMTPGDLKKEGNHLDLAMAVALALQVISVQEWQQNPERWLFAAELGLGGELRPVKGVISFALAAMDFGLRGIIVAQENLQELRILADLKLHRDEVSELLPTFTPIGCQNLADVFNWMASGELSPLKGLGDLGVLGTHPQSKQLSANEGVNFDDMVLSPAQRLAAVTACAGMHSILLRGCPGTGKSMLAQRLPSILPPMVAVEHVESLKVYSQISEKIPRDLLFGRVPFRAPHHQASAPAILGTPETPGELALAHGGVLFLDEFPEFRRDILESLREPLEMGEVRVSRAKKKALWLCRVLLVAACNNCPCGWDGSARRKCRCSSAKRLAYLSRLSGPILERIDMHVNFPENQADAVDFVMDCREERSAQTITMLDQVIRARRFGLARNHRLGVLFNSQLRAKDLSEAAGISSDRLKKIVAESLPQHMSNRALVRTIRVARTLADVDERAETQASDLRQAFLWQAEYAAFDRGETSHIKNFK